jgi:hypothetical protein
MLPIEKFSNYPLKSYNYNSKIEMNSMSIIYNFFSSRLLKNSTQMNTLIENKNWQADRKFIILIQRCENI